MILPKEEIFKALSELGIDITQGSQDTFTSVPSITFSIANNDVELDLDNEITSQNITAVIDIWTESSVQASNILKETESVMRDIGYRLSYSADIPRPNGALFHINCRFETTK